MAKKIACLLAFLTIFTGCSGIRYSVSYDRKEDYSRAKDTYPAGKKVTLYYNLIGTDTDYSFYLDGERLNTTYHAGKGYKITFRMPDHDVKLECRATSSMSVPSQLYAFPQTAVLSFASFDGSGTTFGLKIDPPDILALLNSSRQYDDPNHKTLDGAAYKVTFTFIGQKPGEAVLTIEERSPIGDNIDHLYTATVNDNLDVTIKEQTEYDLNRIGRQTASLSLQAGGMILYANFSDDPAAEAFLNRLSTGQITLSLYDHGNGCKAAELPWEIPFEPVASTANPGTILVEEGSLVLVLSDQYKGSFATIAEIAPAGTEKLLKALEDGAEIVSLWAEWTE